MKSLVSTSLAHFVNDVNTYVFIILYPKLLPLPSELYLIGVLAGLQNLFSVAVSPFVGRVADSRKNYGTLLSVGLSLMGIGIAGYSVSVYFVTGFSLFLFLIPFSVIAGAGGAFYHPLGASVLNEKWKPQLLGRAMGINGSVGSVGRAIYPLAVVALAVYISIPAVTALAVAAFISAGVVLRMLWSVDFLRRGTEQNAGVRANGEVVKGGVHGRNIALGSILPSIIALTLVSFLRGFFMFGVVNFIPVYLKRVGGLQYGLELATVFTLILAMPILGQPVLGNIADKNGRRLALGISIGGSGIAILFLLNTTNLILQVASLAAFGFFGLTGFPLLLPLATAAVPREAATLSSSIVWGVGNVGGGALGPLFIGLLAAPALLGSLNGSFYVATIISLCSLAVLPFVPTSRLKGRSST
ncbi:MAG: MFS transporter [Rhabdochlamydiaceae bacterium]